MSSVEALPSSKLGTKEHWDSVYHREIDNYNQIGDQGEVWFGQEAVQRMVDFVEQAQEEGLFPGGLFCAGPRYRQWTSAL